MTDRHDLATIAVRRAYEARRHVAAGREAPICAIDVAGKCGVDVWFKALPSLEGMYATIGAGTIVLSSLRPPGRQAFTCAHELGHHFLGHGERWDEYVAGEVGPRTDDEWAADRFASYLLMPKRAVVRAFSARGWSASAPTPWQVYVVACELGVGYSSLLNQMSFSLGLLERKEHASLSRATPRSIRESMLGALAPGHMAVIDVHWNGRPADLRVGDLLVLPPATEVCGKHVSVIRDVQHGRLCEAVAPGVTQVKAHAWSCFIRTCRAEYEGHADYRHMGGDDAK